MGTQSNNEKKLQKLSTLLNSDAHQPIFPRTTSLQLTYQLTNILSTRLIIEKKAALRLNSLLMQPQEDTCTSVTSHHTSNTLQILHQKIQAYP